MSMFYITTNQGRTDNSRFESTSLTKVLDFFKNISTSSVTIVKKVVFSKEYDINYTNQIEKTEDFYREVRIYASSKNYSKVITLRFLSVNSSDKEISDSIKNSVLINGEKITRILNIIKFRK